MMGAMWRFQLWEGQARFRLCDICQAETLIAFSAAGSIFCAMWPNVVGGWGYLKNQAFQTLGVWKLPCRTDSQMTLDFCRTAMRIITATKGLDAEAAAVGGPTFNVQYAPNGPPWFGEPLWKAIAELQAYQPNLPITFRTNGRLAVRFAPPDDAPNPASVPWR
jgi:hypothetical protein